MCKEHAFDFLYSMAASRDILFWPPRGQLLRNKPIIPVTHITELDSGVCSTPVPHNDYVTKPSALNVFIDGLAETGVEKGLTSNNELI